LVVSCQPSSIIKNLAGVPPSDKLADIEGKLIKKSFQKPAGGVKKKRKKKLN
jgi:hypothetical protein